MKFRFTIISFQCCYVSHSAAHPNMWSTIPIEPFSWMKNFAFWLEFHLILSQKARLMISQHWFRGWLGTEQATSHYLHQCCIVQWCIYGTRGRWVKYFNWLYDNVIDRREVGTRFASLIFANMRLANLVPTSRRYQIAHSFHAPDSTAVACAKCCGGNSISIWIMANQIIHRMLN